MISERHAGGGRGGGKDRSSTPGESESHEQGEMVFAPFEWHQGGLRRREARDLSCDAKHLSTDEATCVSEWKAWFLPLSCKAERILHLLRGRMRPSPNQKQPGNSRQDVIRQFTSSINERSHHERCANMKNETYRHLLWISGKALAEFSSAWSKRASSLEVVAGHRVFLADFRWTPFRNSERVWTRNSRKNTTPADQIPFCYPMIPLPRTSPLTIESTLPSLFSGWLWLVPY